MKHMAMMDYMIGGGSDPVRDGLRRDGGAGIEFISGAVL